METKINIYGQHAKTHTQFCLLWPNEWSLESLKYDNNKSLTNFTSCHRPVTVTSLGYLLMIWIPVFFMKHESQAASEPLKHRQRTSLTLLIYFQNSQDTLAKCWSSITTLKCHRQSIIKKTEILKLHTIDSQFVVSLLMVTQNTAVRLNGHNTHNLADY